MIDKNLVQKIVADVLRKTRGLPDHQIMHPEREWFTGLGFGLVILGVSVVWYMSVYQHYSNTDNFNTNNKADSAPVVYREQEVAKALEVLKQREQNYAELKSALQAGPVIIPPALPVLEAETQPEAVPTSTPIIQRPIVPPAVDPGDVTLPTIQN